MLEKNAAKATDLILEVFVLPDVKFTFITIYPIILKLVNKIYLQGRKDQADKVVFEVGPKGTFKFPGK
ncbi:hypothetical protein ES703_29458 [subsurface metagenome]